MEAPISSRRSSKRAQIRKAAYRCFRERGYHETSVDDICREAGTSKGSLYWHYDSKQDVFIDILETWANQVMEEVFGQFDKSLASDDFAHTLTESLARELHRGRAVGPLWIEFAAQSQRDPKLQAALAKFFSRARVAIADMLAPEMGFILSEEEIQGLGTAIFAAYLGILTQDLVDPEGARAEESVERLMSVLERWITTLRDLLLGPVPSLPTAPALSRVEAQDLAGFLRSHAPGVAQRLREVRTLVLTAAPLADERIITGWRVLGYEGRRLFGYLRPRRDSVHLGFYQGIALTDPHGLLRGKGKRVRYVPIALEGPLDEVALGGLIEQAWAASR